MRNLLFILAALGLIVGLPLFGCTGTANGTNGENTEEATEEKAEETIEEALEGATGEAAEETLNVAALINDRCTMCHTADKIDETEADADEWEGIIDRMTGMGAKLDNDERTALIDYLAGE